jgi:hypothetical protein
MHRLTLSPRTVVLVLSTIVVSLLLADLVMQYIRYFHGIDRLQFVRLLDLDSENNLSAWYSSVALLLCAVMLAIIGLHHRGQAKKFARHWLALAILFLCLSIDEAASIHEMSDGVIHRWLLARGHLDATLAVIGTAWLLAGFVFTIIVAVTFWRFLMQLPKPTMWSFLIAGGLYFGGAVGVEAVSNHLLNYHSGSKTLGYEFLVALEEAMEMFGVILFIRSLMVYMANQDIRLEFAMKGATVQTAAPALDLDPVAGPAAEVVEELGARLKSRASGGLTV